jgi:hypothetical protein
MSGETVTGATYRSPTVYALATPHLKRNAR